MTLGTAVANQSERSVARPLSVLVPLIKDDLQQGNEAAERASEPYYRAAGEKLLEAKSQLARGELNPWIERNFKIGHRQANRYMELARTTNSIQNGRHRPFSLTDALGEQPRNERPTWPDPVRQIIGRVDVETLNLRQSELKRAEEREAQRTLALQLIDIGYKALATKLHPDKGGSRDAMARLNQVRDRLKQHA